MYISKQYYELQKIVLSTDQHIFMFKSTQMWYENTPILSCPFHHDTHQFMA